MNFIDLRTREGRQAFYQSKEWRTLRAFKLADNPLCEECLKKDRITPAKDVHHLVDIDDRPTLENALNYENLMSLCKSCHSIITGYKEQPTWKPFKIKEFLSKKKSF